MGQLTNVTLHLMNQSSYKDLFSCYINWLILEFIVSVYAHYVGTWHIFCVLRTVVKYLVFFMKLQQ